MKTIFSKGLFSLAVTSIVIYISGCAPVATYKVSENVPTARLRMLTMITSGTIGVMSYSKEDCRSDIQSLGLVIPIYLGTNPTLNMPSRPDRPSGAVYENVIAADRPLISSMFFSFGSIYTGFQKCEVTTTFDPKPGRDYEMEFEFVGVQSETKCRATISQIVSDGNKFTRIPEPSVRPSQYQCKSEEVMRVKNAQDKNK